MSKKLKISIFIIVFLALVFTGNVKATEYYYNSDIKYEIVEYYAGENHRNDPAAQITWINPYVETITIPSQVVCEGKTYTVKTIEEAACRILDDKANPQLKTINLPNTIIDIGNQAFKNLRILTSFTMPDSVTSIGQGMLSDCTNLKSVKISKNIKKLPSDFMEGCTAIESVTVPSGVEFIDYWCFDGCTSLKNISLPNTLKKIEANAFRACAFEEFVMPNSVNDLGGTGASGIFNDCTKLKKITLSNSLPYIPSQTFQRCTSLEEIIIPDSVKIIGSHIFTDSTSLKRIAIPQQVNDIGWGLLSEVPNVKEIIFPAEYRKHEIWQLGTVNGVTFVYPRTIEEMDDGGDYTNCTAWGFSATPVKDFCLEKGISFKELPLITYSTHVQNIGDQAFVTNGEMAGTSGKGYRLENISINLDLSKTGYTGGIEYSTHIQNIGWQNPITSGRSGTSGRGLRLEAIRMNLTGEVAQYFDIYYRVHAQNVGWLGWAKNGEDSGTQGYGYRLEGIEILILPKTLKYAPGVTENAYVRKAPVKTASLSKTNLEFTNKNEEQTLVATFKVDGFLVNDIVWTSSNPSVATVTNGVVKALRNGSAVITASSPSEGLSVTCNVTVNYPVGDYKKGDLNEDGKIDSVDAAMLLNYMKYNDIDERTLLIADMNGDGVITEEDSSLILKWFSEGEPSINYTTHVQNIGWQNYVKDGEMAGTSGRGLRLEGIKIYTKAPITGEVMYSTHIQNIGWQNAVAQNEMSGTSGKGLRLEGIKINLTGELAKVYDVYYRVHAQNVGWLGWAKNGEESGTSGFGYRLEGIEIKLVEKGNSAPGKTERAFLKK